ncbi:MAG: hypothetical protein H0W09_05315, partial [Solirubrobacterales bacterium]|nr:hypothetical protein [Solirubrobacterales bacterium]
WWLLAEEPLRLSPEDLWRGANPLLDEHGAEMMAQIRRMTVPPEALLLRRMEGLLFQVASTIRAEAPWGRFLEELIEGREPFSELGREHERWVAGR